jgi:hypothetical protein
MTLTLLAAEATKSFSLDTLIINLGTTIFSGIVGYLVKRQNSISSAEIKLMKVKIIQLESDNEELKQKATKNENIHIFEQDMINSITDTAIMKMIESENLSKDYAVVAAITDYFKGIANFALDFFKSDLRYNSNISSEDFYKQLETRVNTIMYKLLVIVRKEIDEEKSIKHGNSIVPIKFIEYFGTDDDSKRKEVDCFAINKILITELVKNGLDETKLKKKFIKYTTDFMSIFKDKYASFIKFKNYEEAIR